MSRTTPRFNNKIPSKHSGLPQKVSLMPYVGFFAVGFILANTVAALIQSQFILNPYIVMVLSILVGSYIAVHKFIKHQRRRLASQEINRLTFASIGIVWLLTLLYLGGLWIWVLDAINREVLLEMSAERPLPLIVALVMMIVLTLVSARISIYTFNRLLAPK